MYLTFITAFAIITSIMWVDFALFLEKTFKTRLSISFFIMLITQSALATDNMLIITKTTMKNCALLTTKTDNFRKCCLTHTFDNNVQQDQITHSDEILNDNDPEDTKPSDDTLDNDEDDYKPKNYGTSTVKGGGAVSYIDSYNKNDSISARPLFNYTWTYNKKICTQVGHTNEYNQCICDNGGSFHDNHCWCPMGAWQKNGQCICQPGTIKHESYTGPNNSDKTFNCQNDEYQNPYTFSNATDYTSPLHDPHNDPDFVDWDDPLSVFWHYYDTTGEEIGMTFSEAFDQQQVRNNSKKEPIPKITIWKAFGITATKGTQKINIDVVGDSRCITPDANLDDNTGAECACSIKSVSTGEIQEKWVFNPWASFYFTLQPDRSPQGICRRLCAQKCSEAFARDEYNVRYSLMKHWKP